MALMIIDSKNLIDIADAIRSKLASGESYKPQEMADAIMSISGGGNKYARIQFIHYTDLKSVTINPEEV